MAANLSASLGYVLCASPRSGSTLLCDLLTQTGVAGVPASYFRPASIAGFARRWDVDENGDRWGRRYADAVRAHGTGGTGCFGLRMMWTDMPVLLARLGTLHPGASTDRERLRLAFGVDRFVHLERGDRVAQAVSLVIAAQTGLWHRNADGSERQRTGSPQPPRYDHTAIASALRLLDEETSGWTTWFESTGVTPVTITYEQLSRDPARELQRVVGHLRRTSPAPAVPGTAKLAGSQNEEWTTRFRAER
ncbi:MAG: Stf0 family sulfotransferase [Ilumatobacteraceae bacterium]